MSWLKKHPYLLSVVLYLPALFNFFSGDDWFHLRITQISSVKEFINFFSFFFNAHSAALYRPLSTQTFFFVFQKLFELTAWPYYLFVLLCFGYSLHLVYKFALSQFRDVNKSLVATFIYGISVSNFTRLYFLSAFQEIALVIFSLLCLLTFQKSKWKSLLFFVLALLSKETAIVLPLLLLIFNFKSLKKQIVVFISIIIASLVYLYFRLGVFGMAVGDSYAWNFSPVKMANTLMWYVLWSFGAPELLVDYVGSGLRLVPKFFTDYRLWWQIIIPLLLGTIVSSGVLFVQKVWSFVSKTRDGFRVKPRMTDGFMYILLFFIALLPVLFLPAHKFTLELGLPLVGFSLVITWLLFGKKQIFSYIFIAFYLTLNLSMNYLIYTRHYSVSRSKISDEIVSYLSANYPKYPEGKYFEFINDTGDYGAQWGQSKQISQSVSGSDLFRVFYRDANIKVYYKDSPEERPKDQTPIILSSKQFLNP